MSQSIQEAATELAVDTPIDSRDAPAELSGRQMVLPPTARLSGNFWAEMLADAQKFEQELITLRNHNRGAMAALRRNAGVTLGEARGVAWIEGRLFGKRRHCDEQYFLVATLFDHNRMRPISGDFGETMRRVRENASDSFERRFLVLLDAQFDQLRDALDGSKSGGGELAYRLGQMVKLAASKEVGVNWPVLLADLCCWEWTGKPVQKKWARNFYAPRLAPDDDLSAASLLSSNPA